MKTNSYAGIHPHIVAVIARQARKLIGRYGLTASDVHDIEQDLHLKVWTSLPGLSTTVFAAAINQIVNHEIIDLIRKRERECRDWRCVAFSVDDHALGSDHDDDNDPEGYADILDEDLLIGLGYSPSWQSRRWECADVEEGMARLPGDLRDLAETLDACGGNLSEAARMLGVSRKKARIMLARLQDAMAWLREE
jgi:DNA-directed RNA polymerase specialized sigma24 family protein